MLLNALFGVPDLACDFLIHDGQCFENHSIQTENGFEIEKSKFSLVVIFGQNSKMRLALLPFRFAVILLQIYFVGCFRPSAHKNDFARVDEMLRGLIEDINAVYEKCFTSIGKSPASAILDEKKVG